MLLTFVQQSNGRQKRQSSEISNPESHSECGPDPEPDHNGDGEASLRHTTHPQSQDVPKREIIHQQISSGGDVGGAAKRLKSVDAHGEPGEEEEEGDGSSHHDMTRSSIHIIGGKQCGVYAVDSKQLVPRLSAADAIAAVMWKSRHLPTVNSASSSLTNVSTTTGAHIYTFHTDDFDSPVFVDSI
jgi:hypothetical protein